MRTTDTSLWMSFDFPSVPIPRAQSRFYSSDCNLFPTVNPPSSTQGKNKQTKPENLYTVVKWLKKNTKQLYKLQNCLFSLPPWGWYSWFWTLRGKPQTKKKSITSWAWVGETRPLLPWVLPNLLKIHSYINNFAIQNSGAKYKVVPSSTLTGQWYRT